MARAGEMPSAAAAACMEVVLKGAGGRWVRLFFVTAVTVPVLAASTLAKAALAACSSVKRPWACTILKRASSSAPTSAARPLMTQ